MKKIILATAFVATMLVACKTSKQAATTPSPVTPIDCSNKNYTYATDIKPILESKCSKCHNANNKGDFNSLNLESTKKNAQEGKLLGTIKHQKGYPSMPKYSAPLPQESIDKIECWIKGGMKE